MHKERADVIETMLDILLSLGMLTAGRMDAGYST